MKEHVRTRRSMCKRVKGKEERRGKGARAELRRGEREEGQEKEGQKALER